MWEWWYSGVQPLSSCWRGGASEGEWCRSMFADRSVDVTWDGERLRCNLMIRRKRRKRKSDTGVSETIRDALYHATLTYAADGMQEEVFAVMGADGNVVGMKEMDLNDLSFHSIDSVSGIRSGSSGGVGSGSSRVCVAGRAKKETTVVRNSCPYRDGVVDAMRDALGVKLLREIRFRKRRQGSTRTCDDMQLSQRYDVGGNDWRCESESVPPFTLRHVKVTTPCSVQAARDLADKTGLMGFSRAVNALVSRTSTEKSYRRNAEELIAVLTGIDMGETVTPTRTIDDPCRTIGSTQSISLVGRREGATISGVPFQSVDGLMFFIAQDVKSRNASPSDIRKEVCPEHGTCLVLSGVIWRDASFDSQIRQWRSAPESVSLRGFVLDSGFHATHLIPRGSAEDNREGCWSVFLVKFGRFGPLRVESLPGLHAAFAYWQSRGDGTCDTAYPTIDSFERVPGELVVDLSLCVLRS